MNARYHFSDGSRIELEKHTGKPYGESLHVRIPTTLQNTAEISEKVLVCQRLVGHGCRRFVGMAATETQRGGPLDLGDDGGRENRGTLSWALMF